MGGTGDRAGAGAWPVLGRDDEVDYLTAALVEGAPGAVVSGDLGVGKTSLARRVADRLVDLGWAVSTHTASEARSGIPFAAFGSLLDATGDTDPLERLLRATERVRSSTGPGVLVQVDDAHWLDDTSLAFVQHLAESASATLLFTVRVPHERSGRMTSLARTLGLTRLQLQPLSQTETIALVRDVLPDAGAAVAHRLWTLTDGNPLYLREVVTRSIEAHGAGAWGPDDIADTALADVVDARLDDLDAAERKALELVAVGGDTGVVLLGELTSEEAVLALEGRRLLSVTEDERRLVARLTHPIYGELIAARMGAAAGRARRGELLDAIGRHGRRRRSDLVQTAVWSIEHGDVADPDLLLDVARQLCAIVPDEPTGVVGLPALRGDLLGTAARLAMAASEHGGGFGAAEMWFQIESSRDGRSPATADALKMMRALASDEATETKVLVAASGLQLANDWVSSPEVIEQLEELQASVTTAAARRSVDTMLAVTMALYDRHDEAIELARSALDDASTVNRDRLLAAATLSAGLVQQGNAVEGLEVAESAILEVGAEADPWGLGALIIARINALGCCGRLVEAEELTTSCLLLAQATGNESSVYLFSLAQGLLALLRGHPEDAIAAADLSLASFSRPADVDVTADRPAYAVLAQAHALAGHRAEAVDAAGRMGASRSQLFAPAKERAEAAAAALEGRRSAAVDLLRATASAGRGGVPGVVTCLHDLLRLGERGVGEELRHLADVEGSPLWAACARHADAIDAGDGDALDSVAEQFALMGADLWAAEAAAGATAAHRVAGDGVAAGRSAARSEELATRCPGAVSPMLNLEEGTAPSLTKREQEVAQLAVAGWTDKAIADELVLSVRTVESHLYRIYFKLGIESRSDLASVLDL
jgi:DNA-binding CsgD family transcriptional regulator